MIFWTLRYKKINHLTDLKEVKMFSSCHYLLYQWSKIVNTQRSKTQVASRTLRCTQGNTECLLNIESQLKVVFDLSQMVNTPKCYCGFKMGTERTRIGTELPRDSGDKAERSNIIINKTKKVGSSTSASDEVACYWATLLEHYQWCPVTSAHRVHILTVKSRLQQ